MRSMAGQEHQARRAKRSAVAVAALAAAGVLAACGSSTGSDAADTIATKAVATYAAGRWRCETDQTEYGDERHLTTEIAISGDGRFAFEETGGSQGPLTGTWSIKGLELRLSIPWDDDGQSGFHPWVYEADADPPTHLDGRRTDLAGDDTTQGGVADLDVVELSEDRLVLHQDEEPGLEGTDYSWDVTCERTSDDPGAIPPTIPSTPAG